MTPDEIGTPFAALRWVARLIVALAVVAAVVTATGYRWGPERHWLLAFLQYLPYPIHLAPALAAVALSLVLGRLWRLAALAALVLVVWPVMGLEIRPGDPADGRRTVRVMTYNIKSHEAMERPGGYARLAQEVDSHDADIVVFQNAAEPSALRRLGQTPVAALLGTRHRRALGEFVIASRFPLRDCERPAMPSGGAAQPYARCVADIDGFEIDLYAVHLATPRHALVATRREALDGVDEWQRNIAERMAQAEALARDVRGRTRPVVLAGDFNAPDTSLVMRALREAGLRNAFSVAGRGYGHTYGHSLRPGISFLRIDHVLVAPPLGVAAAYAGGDAGSPHRPFVADLLIPPAGAQAGAESDARFAGIIDPHPVMSGPPPR